MTSGRYAARACSALALLTTAVGIAHAYEPMRCSNGRTVTHENSNALVNLSTVSFPAGSATEQALQRAMARWTDVGGSGLVFSSQADADGSLSIGNRINEVGFSAIDGRSGVLGATYVRYDCSRGYIIEADVVFDDAENWVTGGTWADFVRRRGIFFESVALHEFGHVAGLAHEDDTLTVMNTYYPTIPFGQSLEFDAWPDDRQGLRAAYGPDGTTETDIAATAWDVVQRAPAQSTIEAYAGGTIEIEFTVANLGNVDVDAFDIVFFLDRSADGLQDITLGTNVGAWATAGFTGTFTRALQIPEDTPPGTYPIGYRLDYQDLVAESNEANNFQELPEPVVVKSGPPPPDPYPGITLSDFTLGAPEVSGCKSVTGKVTLAQPAPAGGVKITLSEDLSSASVPASVTVPEGTTSKNFSLKTVAVSALQGGLVSATLGTTTMRQGLAVLPMGVYSLTLSPTSVVGGLAVVGTAKLECKAGPGDILVDLASSNATVASPGAASLLVPVGSTSATFQVATTPVTATTKPTITATASGIAKTKTLTVTPAAAVSPTSLKFGSIVVGNTGGPLNATLSNKGAVPYTIGSISLTGTYASWFAQSNDCPVPPATLAAGTSCTIGVTFKPLAAASKSAKLTIATSATSTALSVSLSGTGVAPPP